MRSNINSFMPTFETNLLPQPFGTIYSGGLTNGEGQGRGANGAEFERRIGARIDAPQAPRRMGCGERVSPSRLGKILGRRRCPLHRKKIRFSISKWRLLVHSAGHYFCSSAIWFKCKSVVSRVKPAN